MTRTRRARIHLIRRGLIYSLGLCLLILLIGGIGFWWLEPGIHSLQDGLWLAFTTAATVGYGDLVPRTPTGRAFSVLVVLLGLAVLSLVTASLAALFVEQEVEQEERQIERDLMRELHALRRQVTAVQERLDRHRGTEPPRQETR
ncbi:MAG: potassium channel family protein [Hydrogenophaga sp.]